MTFKKQLRDVYNSKKQEMRGMVVQYLTEKFNVLFEKYPAAKSIKINTSSEYNDSEYTNSLSIESDSIKINGYSYFDILNEKWDDDTCIENIGLSGNDLTDIAEEAELIFSQIETYIFLHIYGGSFGLKVDRTGVTIETSDF